jgi:hypothetical protein
MKKNIDHQERITKNKRKSQKVEEFFNEALKDQ